MKGHTLKRKKIDVRYAYSKETNMKIQTGI